VKIGFMGAHGMGKTIWALAIAAKLKPEGSYGAQLNAISSGV